MAVSQIPQTICPKPNSPTLLLFSLLHNSKWHRHSFGCSSQILESLLTPLFSHTLHSICLQILYHFLHNIQFSSVTHSDPILGNPMHCSTPGLFVHCQLPEFTPAHVHWVGDAIQPSHPVSPTSPPALNLSQHQHLFQWVSSASGGQNIGASASILPMNSQGWSPLGLTSLISMLSKGLYPRFSRGI